MLGCFLAALGSALVDARFGFLRERINDYLRLVGSELVLPDDREWVSDKHDQIIKIVWDDLQQRSSELGDFFFLGASAYISVVQFEHFPEEVAGLRSDFLRRLDEVGLPSSVANDFWARASSPKDSLAVDDFFSAVLRLARGCVEPLNEEAHTAFVAMPFAEPFATRYQTLYVPLLRANGYHALRAWGGMAFEDYWDLLLTLIEKSGVVLADLTGANPNVMHEVGLAEGMGKTAFLIIEKSEEEPASNLGYHAVMSYDPHDPAWPGRSIEDLTKLWGAAVQRMRHRGKGGTVCISGGESPV